MNHIKYKIVEVWPADHSIVVRYYSESLTESELASQIVDDQIIRCRTDVSITVPIPEPSEEELDKLIMQNCPLHFFEMKEKIKDPAIDTSMPLSMSLLNTVKETTSEDIKKATVVDITASRATLTADEIQELLMKL
jgi:hypothetical protein